MQKRILLKFNIPGFHYWKDAPGYCSYLQNRHRHVFYWEIEIKIQKSRQYEFIDLSNKIKLDFLNTPMWKTNLYPGLDFGPLSCEELAEETRIYLKAIDLIPTKISVLEDNENGAIIYV